MKARKRLDLGATRSAGHKPPREHLSDVTGLVERFGTERQSLMVRGLLSVLRAAQERSARATYAAAVAGIDDVVWAVWGEMPRAQRRNWTTKEVRNGR